MALTSATPEESVVEAATDSRMPGGPDKQLEKLEADAERTGDRTAVIAYRKKLKERGKK